MIKKTKIKHSGEDTIKTVKNARFETYIIADGVGSSIYAKKAAKLAVKTFLEVCELHPTEVHAAFNKKWDEYTSRNENYASTIVAYFKSKTNEYFYIVGDCFAYNGELLYQSLFGSTVSVGGEEHLLIETKTKDFLISSDGILKFVNNIDELKIVIKEIMEESDEAKEFLQRAKSLRKDDISILIKKG